MLNSHIKLLELILIRRLHGVLGSHFSAAQFAYQRDRSAELLLADLDGFIQDGSGVGKATYLVRLDIWGGPLIMLTWFSPRVLSKVAVCRFSGN